MRRAAGVLVWCQASCPVGGPLLKIFVPRLRCAPCRVSHALLPAFVLAWRLEGVSLVLAGAPSPLSTREGGPAAERTAPRPVTPTEPWPSSQGIEPESPGRQYRSTPRELAGDQAAFAAAGISAGEELARRGDGVDLDFQVGPADVQFAASGRGRLLRMAPASPLRRRRTGPPGSGATQPHKLAHRRGAAGLSHGVQRDARGPSRKPILLQA